MTTRSYTATIEVASSAKEVFDALTHVTKWWSTDFTGKSANLHDEFIINHPGQHYSKQKLTEVIPNRKIVWLVTESKLNWLKNNPEEWTNTRMIFEISTKDDPSKSHRTVLHFTHEGLVPEQECYALCEQGWNIIIKNWLFHFITTGTPSTEMARAAEIRNKSLQDKAKTENRNYHKTMLVNASAEETMKKISQINRWWIKEFSDTVGKLHDTFRVPFTDPSFVDFVVSQYVPGKKVAWKVTDCYLIWFEDKKEWNNTEVVFELSEEEGKTRIDFTHIGLVPEVECYTICEKGWNGHTNDLVKLINEGKGLAQ